MSAGVREDRPQPDEAAIRRDELFKLLGNERRRHAVEILRRRDEAITLDALATRVAAAENDVAVGEVTGRQRKRVYTSLQQTHLPRLDEAGAVTFDKEAGTIAPSRTLTEVSLHLDVVSPSGVPESLGYLAGAVCSLLLAVAVLLGVPPVSAVPPLGWAAFVLGAFVVAALLRRYAQSGGDDPL
jgi:DNA-binding transcriptional ArsR family regulator